MGTKREVTNKEQRLDGRINLRILKQKKELLVDYGSQDGYNTVSRLLMALIDRYLESKINNNTKNMFRKSIKQSQDKCQTLTKEEATTILKRIDRITQDFQAQGAELKEMSKALTDKSSQRNFLRLFMKQGNQVKEMYEITQELYKMIEENKAGE